jgi:hypothetical protein
MTHDIATAPAREAARTQSTSARLRADPGYQAFWALRLGFSLLPVLMGADKFAHVLTDWDKYYAPRLHWLLPGSMTVHQAMYVVGVVEIVAGLVVLVAPRLGSLLVACWLLGIIVDLVLLSHRGDIALRDFGLFLAAATLARLSWAYLGSARTRRDPAS